MSTLSTIRGLHKPALDGELTLLLITHSYIDQIGQRFKVTWCTKTYLAGYLVAEKAVTAEISHLFLSSSCVFSHGPTQPRGDCNQQLWSIYPESAAKSSVTSRTPKKQTHGAGQHWCRSAG